MQCCAEVPQTLISNPIVWAAILAAMAMLAAKAERKKK
jgi:hypothetical protein